MTAIIDPKTHRINGTRTTIYHVMDYTNDHWTPEKIVEYLPITVEQVYAAIKFIEQNKAEVSKNYQVMLDRCARGNSPEVEAKLVQSREKVRRLREELETRAQNCC